MSDEVKEPGDGMTVEEGVNDPGSGSEEQAPPPGAKPADEEPEAPADAGMSDEGRAGDHG